MDVITGSRVGRGRRETWSTAGRRCVFQSRREAEEGDDGSSAQVEEAGEAASRDGQAGVTDVTLRSLIYWEFKKIKFFLVARKREKIRDKIQR